MWLLEFSSSNFHAKIYQYVYKGKENKKTLNLVFIFLTLQKLIARPAVYVNVNIQQVLFKCIYHVSSDTLQSIEALTER